MNRIIVLGGGESGTGSAILARKQGFDVFLSDNGSIKTKYKEMLYNYDIPLGREQAYRETDHGNR